MSETHDNGCQCVSCYTPSRVDDKINSLQSELDALKHDHERQATHLTEMVTENERLQECIKYILSHPLLDEVTIRCRLREALQKGGRDSD